MLLGNPIIFQQSPETLSRLRGTIFEASIGHGVEILGTSEARYGVGLGIEWGRPARVVPTSNGLAAREEVHLRLFRSFTSDEGFDGLVAGFGSRWHFTSGRMKNGYFEIGSGVGITDGVSIDVNSHFNFVSFLGAGFFFNGDDHAPRFGIRWVHVSNAGIEPPNRGLNQFEAVYGIRF
jgi:hypothetical protein